MRVGDSIRLSTISTSMMAKLARFVGLLTTGPGLFDSPTNTPLPRNRELYFYRFFSDQYNYQSMMRKT